MTRSIGLVVVMLTPVILAVPRAVTAGPVLPEFSPSNFAPNAAIDNPYFPLRPGTRYRASGTR